MTVFKLIRLLARGIREGTISTSDQIFLSVYGRRERLVSAQKSERYRSVGMSEEMDNVVLLLSTAAPEEDKRLK